MNSPNEQRSLAKMPLHAEYEAVRAYSVALAASLSEEDCCAQSMPDASPVKWHLAHTTWFFETFILERHEPEFRAYHPAFRMLFNSYYNGIGEKHVRAQRGLLTRPSFDEVLAFRHDVDARKARLIERRLHAAPQQTNRNRSTQKQQTTKKTSTPTTKKATTTKRRTTSSFS